MVVENSLQVIYLNLKLFNLLNLLNIYTFHVSVFDFEAGVFILNLVQILHLLNIVIFLVFFGEFEFLELLFDVSFLFLELADVLFGVAEAGLEFL